MYFLIVIFHHSTPGGAAAIGETGSFSVVFDAPPSEGSNHIVMASDGVNQFSFFYVGFMIPPYFLCGFYGLVDLVIFAGGFVIGTRWGGKFKFFSPRRKETPENPVETEEIAEQEA